MTEIENSNGQENPLGDVPNGVPENMPNNLGHPVYHEADTNPASQVDNDTHDNGQGNGQGDVQGTDKETKRAIETILMVAESPVKPQIMAELIETSVKEIENLCAELAEEYQVQNRGFILAKVAGGYRFQSHPDLDAYVERFALESSTARLSNAALETLAIIAYRQPISRAQVAEIRGVNADAVMRTLTVRGLITEMPGSEERAAMFGTTDEFLERLGINSLDELPKLAEFVPPIEVAETLEAELRSTARLNVTHGGAGNESKNGGQKTLVSSGESKVVQEEFDDTYS